MTKSNTLHQGAGRRLCRPTRCPRTTRSPSPTTRRNPILNTTAVTEGSPAERKCSGFTVTNPIADPATYLNVAEQDSGLFRAYLGQTWVHLDTGETRLTPVAYESLAGDPMSGN